ncbi:helix-turn-helix domain-containing protein [Sphingomonas sp. NFR04]|uniref:helix-turn-helix domain-containing protein n=1 Tax=Sphingomonas sp. NFR04 TaxID=1566283 RepID=UPI0020C8EDDC|nr:helix-turn-helix transcriptional regulator [Sphingomonas sp. NFR04]
MQPEELKQLRTARGVSQKEFGTAIGLSAVFIGMMERGEKPIELRTALAAKQWAAGMDRIGLKATDPEERAARKLCEYYGHFPDSETKDGPAWRAYLPVVRLVLDAARPVED